MRDIILVGVEGGINCMFIEDYPTLNLLGVPDRRYRNFACIENTVEFSCVAPVLTFMSSGICGFLSSHICGDSTKDWQTTMQSSATAQMLSYVMHLDVQK